MPARSQAQRGYLNWKFGHEWVKRHHFDNPGKLPKRSNRRRDQMIAQFARKHRG
jgi:hypothetical protein